MKMSKYSSSILPNEFRVSCVATIQKTAFFFSHILKYSLVIDVFQRIPLQCLNPKNVTLSVKKSFSCPIETDSPQLTDSSFNYSFRFFDTLTVEITF